MKLNNEQFYLTNDSSNDNKQDIELCELGVLDVYEHKQPIIYYKSGCPEIENIFSKKSYLNNGFICNLIATRKQVSLYFCKYKVDMVSDLAGVHIYRSEIRNTIKSKCNDLDFIKKESIKHQSKYMFKRGSFLGAIIGAATENINNVNLRKSNGICYTINFKNINDIESKLVIYCNTDYEYEIDDFMQRFCNM